MCSTASALVRSILYTLLKMKKGNNKINSTSQAQKREKKLRKSNTLVTKRCQRGISKQKWQTEKKYEKENKHILFFLVVALWKKKTNLLIWKSSHSTVPRTCMQTTFGDNTNISHTLPRTLSLFRFYVFFFGFIWSLCALIAAADIRLNFYETKNE